MDATAEIHATATREDYKSRPGALIWCFRKSGDRWKSKHQDLKATVKGLKNQIAAVTKSREQWRAKAERAGDRLTALETELAALRAQMATSEEKKLGWQTWGESLDFPPLSGRIQAILWGRQANSTGTTLLSPQVCQRRKKADQAASPL